MLRKVLTVSVAALFMTASVAIVSPAGAATIKNGVACSKYGAKTKVGSKSYICTKNILVTPTKNTWTSSNCVAAMKLYREGLANAEDMLSMFGDAGQDSLATAKADLTKSITPICAKGK